ncbi:MAG: phosphoribosylanthranilate isomerase [Gammaproteobacteria bacterium]|nr:phosphoribosylanthranilate isomerase [Gammaproteobacteria bacterium]
MKPRIRVKICGITREEDALAAAQCGADAIGLVFYPPSARHVSVSQARQIAAQVPPFVTVVGLFLDATEEAIRAVLEEVPLDMLQFHGRETAAECDRWGYRYLKSVPMKDQPDLHDFMLRYPNAAGFLLDTVSAGEAGGSGQVFAWQALPTNLTHPTILAGGLTPENVSSAMTQTNCYAVDVSSGVEDGKGIKSLKKIRAFMTEVRAYESH